MDQFTIIAVTCGAFAATNLDNLVLLVALYARYEGRSPEVAFGYIAGMLLIGAISFALGKVAEAIPVNYLGLLGIVPVLIGVTALAKLIRRSSTDPAGDDGLADTGRAVFTATLMTQLANSTDTIGTFSILFADSKEAADYLVALAFISMLALFASAAFHSLRHRWLSGFLRRYGPYVTPFILIAVGLYVLSNTASDMMPG